MSWATCYKGSNNIHFHFPPLMSDSRNFSSYIPGTVIDTKIKEISNIKTNHQYRLFLQANADTLIQGNQLSACDQCSSYSHTLNNKKNTNNTNNTNTVKSNSPYIFNTILSNDQPFGYESSDLKNLYLSRQQINATKYAPRLELQN